MAKTKLQKVKERAARKFRRLTSSRRVLPDFMIVGTQKGGTTTLYWHLHAHSAVMMSLEKEPQFFTLKYDYGLDFYRSFFVTQAARRGRERAIGRPVRIGEATPCYMFCPAAPPRMHQHFPDARLIVMLRNPIDRAYSHFNMECQRGREQRSFEQAIEQEQARLEGDLSHLWDRPRQVLFSKKDHPYLWRSLYLEQMRRLLDIYPPTQVHVMTAESYRRNTQAEYDRVLNFLDLPPMQLAKAESHNTRRYDSQLAQATRQQLASFFAPHNQKLSKLLNMTFDWDEPKRG